MVNKMNQLSIRFLVVGALVLGMLIPLVFVGGVADERQRYYAQAVDAIADSWGASRPLSAPCWWYPCYSTTRLNPMTVKSFNTTGASTG